MDKYQESKTYQAGISIYHIKRNKLKIRSKSRQ